LTFIAPIRPLQLCADGGYQLRLGVLGVPLIMVPDTIDKQYVRAARCIVSIITYMLPGKFPCTPILHRSRMSGCKKIAPATNISCSKCCICDVPGPICRGSVPMYVPPLAIKGEACTVTKKGSLRPSSGSQVHTSSQAQYIAQWSRVLRSGGPNHYKPLCVLVFVHRLADRQNA
jgi:hypothetical protein